MRCCTTALRSTACRGSRPWASAASGSPRDGWMAVGASRRTASSHSTPHGGQLSEGRLHGFGFVYEAVLQLRHQAGDRQVNDARTAVVSTGGPVAPGVMLLQRAT